VSEKKTFPLRLNSEFHAALKEKAEQENKSIHQYVIDSIKKEMDDKGRNE
jgi:predicted HicB family RNase H-like nuclease